MSSRISRGPQGRSELALIDRMTASAGNVLIVEDDAETREMLSVLLSAEGFSRGRSLPLEHDNASSDSFRSTPSKGSSGPPPLD
jgi:hypothetical protein